LQADTIVMCMRSYRGWLKWLHRNTALNVMRQAPCTIQLVSKEASDNELFRPQCLLSVTKTRGELGGQNHNSLIYSV